jgi:hypothetical protein
MKVQVIVTLDVDPEAWALEYGLEPKEVRGDVKRWASNTLWNAAPDYVTPGGAR